MDEITKILHIDGNEEEQRNKIEQIMCQILLKHVTDLIYVMKVESGPIFSYLFMNEMAINQTKVSPTYLGKTLQAALDKSLATHLQHHYEFVVKHKDTHTFQDKVTLPNGEEIYGESILTPIIDEHNQVKYIVSITRDISKSVLEKQRLLESEQRYKSLVDQNLDAVLSVDENGVILNVNESTCSLIGWDTIDLVDSLIFSIFHAHEKTAFELIFAETLKGFPQEKIGLSIHHKNGNEIIGHVKTIPIVIDNRVVGIYLIVKDITDQQKLDEMLKFMAFHDHLTGLPNRSSLRENLMKSIKSAKEKNEKVALMYIDLDRFKFLNDSLGHNMGDVLLKDVAIRLSNIEDDVYSVYRQGGDEFIVLLKSASRVKATTYATRILEEISRPFILDGEEYYISGSLGISLFPNDGEDIETLIKCADTALYRVKERGRGHFQFYSKDMHAGSSYAMTLETGLRTAIERNELQLYFQPQIDLNTRQTTSFEALLRWNHPTLGFVSPGEFIPIAEETGIIISIGEWVIKEVCERMREWNSQNYQPVTIAVNLSPKQFLQANILEVIQSEMERNGIQPSTLEFEITEGSMQDSKEALDVLNRLKEVGVGIAVDDFGTGFSSLSHLQHFPIDTLKIDQSFVREVLSDKKNAAITTTIIHLAQSLGLTVTAEGIETKEQLVFFEKMKCDKAQGFYFSKPLPEKEMIDRYFKRKTV
ncbi:EAL domain-containing protein [Bacillus timonensis]|nr:EAL domain-containing protein [Bacillus timonensis]